MGLFLSTTINRIDKKGRVSVPAAFRTTLATEAFQGVILFQSYTKPAIEGVSMQVMEQLNSRLDSHLDFFSNDHDAMATVLFGDAIPLSFDGDGRITLPQTLMEFAGLDDQAAFVGLGQKFQIWAPDAFETERQSARAAVQSKHITLPKAGE